MYAVDTLFRFFHPFRCLFVAGHVSGVLISGYGYSAIRLARGSSDYMSYSSGAAYPTNAHPIVLDDAFRDLLTCALIARHRARIRSQPELMFMRSTWDADGWAQAEATTLLVHIRAALENRASG